MPDLFSGTTFFFSTLQWPLSKSTFKSCSISISHPCHRFCRLFLVIQLGTDTMPRDKSNCKIQHSKVSKCQSRCQKQWAGCLRALICPCPVCMHYGEFLFIELHPTTTHKAAPWFSWKEGSTPIYWATTRYFCFLLSIWNTVWDLLYWAVLKFL